MSLMLFDNPRALFIRVRKTGSTSIVRGIFGGVENVIELGEGAFNPAWRDRFRFAFVRNPFDRLVSCLLMFKSYGITNSDEEALRDALTPSVLLDLIEDETLPFVGESFRAKLRLHALPISHPSYHIDEAQFIGRFETFADDYAAVARRLGSSPVEIPHHRNRKREFERRDFFDDATRRRAERVLRLDLDRFDYSFAR